MTTTTGRILIGPTDAPLGFSIEWKIDEYKSQSGRLHSPRISLSGIPGEWNMWLDREDSRYCAFAFSIYLRYSPPPRSTLQVFDSGPRGFIEFVGYNQRFSVGCRDFQKALSDNVWNSLIIVCEHCQITTETAKTLPNLSIHVEGELQDASPSTPALPDEMNRLYKLVGDTEVILMGNDHVEVTAHCSILSLKSPVFAAMFERDMLEKKTGKVTMPDFSSDLIREMLHHVYTGKEPGQLGQMASSLLRAADKYDLQDLKEMCEVHLARQLDKSNCQETLDQANTFNCSYLKRMCMEWSFEHMK